ncbi:hypothetical protein TR2A62_1796 [Thalassobium sp. R2A62]|nr:hypothetical protein TR2A62_1796 [Thalassobium sp. R2A62]
MIAEDQIKALICVCVFRIITINFLIGCFSGDCFLGESCVAEAQDGGCGECEGA